jgi:hypothetical protein
MKSFLLLLSLSLVFASCSTSYKSGQTPDDVYFSPERPRAEYVRVEDDENDQYYRGQSNSSSNDYYNYEEERYLRMKVRNRQRWSYLDNDFYSYNPYVYGNYNYYNSPWNSYSYWDHYYNPYARQVIIFNSKTPVVNRPRTINLRTFDGQSNTSNNTRVYNNKTGNSSNSKSYSTQQRSGGELRNIFNNSSNNNSSNSSSSNRSSTNSSGSSGGSSSSGGGSAPARRF